MIIAEHCDRGADLRESACDLSALIGNLRSKNPNFCGRTSELVWLNDADGLLPHGSSNSNHEYFGRIVPKDRRQAGLEKCVVRFDSRYNHTAISSRDSC